MRIEKLSEKNFNQGQAISVAHFARNYSSWWNSNEPQAGQSLPKGFHSKAKQASQLLQEAKHLGLQLPEQESSSTQSAGQSRQEMSVAGGANSRDQSLSSESGQDESCGRSGESENKPFFLFGSSEVPMSYPPAGDPYFGGFVTAYVPQLQGSQMAGVASPRVPLPLSFAEDGPIFVNPKQYHGILRRRQSRAKLEAQNKLVKSRKPYLHESRHRHALNRVRGTGGRFLGTKNIQETNPAKKQGNPCSEIKSTSNREEVFYSGSDDGFLGHVNPTTVTRGGKSSLALY